MEDLPNAAAVGPLIEDADGYLRCYTDAAARRSWTPPDRRKDPYRK